MRRIYALVLATISCAQIGALSADPLTPPPVVLPAIPDRPEMTAEFARDVTAKQHALQALRDAFVAKPPRGSSESNDAAKVQQYIGQLQADGRFEDLLSPTPADWTMALNRLNAIAGRFKRLKDDQRTSLRPLLLKSIVLYCRYMIAHPDPFTGAAFTGPRNAAGIYFTLYDELQNPDAADAAAALKDATFLCWYSPISDGDDRRKTDPNRLDTFLRDAHFIVGNTTYRPIVECATMQNSTQMMDVVHAIVVRSLANRTAYQIESESLWGEQGLTMDGNGFAHGRQSYLFGYVRDWFNGVCTIATQFRGTPWEIAPSSWDLCADMLLDGVQWYVYKNDIDWSVAGRHNMYPGAIDPADKNLLKSINQLLDVSQQQLARKAEIIALRERLNAHQEFAGNRYFWNAEDMIERRPSSYLSVNLSSVRSNSPESVLPNSHVNAFMAMGAMMIKTRGDEYLQARGAINYAALPGTTGMPSRPLPADQTWNGFPGDNVFCGGVSDGSVGVCGFEQKQKLLPVTGRKGYFFFDDCCVAVGASITTGEVETTLNQTRLADDACSGSGDESNKIALPTDSTLPTTATRWFYNDGVGYVIPAGLNPKNARLKVEQRTTRWGELAKINAGKKEAADAQVPIFQLSLAHQNGPDDGRYCYAILPNATPEQTAAAARLPPFAVLQNSASAQIVRHNASGIIQAIFYEAATAQCDDFSITVDRPAVLMLRPIEGGYRLLVSDPLQRDPAGTVRVTTTLPGTPQTAAIAFPERPWIGKAAQAELRR